MKLKRQRHFETDFRPMEHSFLVLSPVRCLSPATAAPVPTPAATSPATVPHGGEYRIVVLPAVLPKHVWEKYDWNDPVQNPEIGKPSVVNGTYFLKEWKRDDHATFTRNDAFFKGPANIETVTYRIVPNPSVSALVLLNGEVDSGAVSANDFDKAKASDQLNLYQWEPASAVWDYIGFNLHRATVSDVEFRHALAFATPRDVIAQKIYNNLSKPTYSTFPPSSWVYNPNVPKYDYGIETAKSTLEKAGYRLDANGKTAAPIKLKSVRRSPVPAREKVALILQEQIKQLGIDLEIVALEGAAHLQTIRTEPFDWDLDILAWRAGIEPSDIRDILSESAIPGLDRGAYVNKKQEELWEQGEREFDPAKRKAIYQDIQRILAEHSPCIFLAYRTGWTFLNKRVVPNPVTRLGINYDFYKWYITGNPN